MNRQAVRVVPRWVVPTLASLPLGLLASCGPGAPEFMEVEVPTEPVALEAPITLGAVVVALRGDSREGMPRLGGVAGGRFLQNGGFVLANAASTSLVIFDAEGKFEREVKGGTEHVDPMERVHDVKALSDGTLLAWDRALRRITTISSAGEIQGAVEVPDRGSLPADAVHLLGADRVAVIHRQPPRVYPAGFSREEVVVSIQDLKGNETARLGTVPGRGLYGAPRANILVPFGPRLLVAATSNRLFVGDGQAAELLEYDSEGKPLRRLVFSMTRATISPTERQEVLARNRRPTTSDAWMAALEASFRAETFPSFDRLVGSGDGRLWLRRHGGLEGSREWMVLDPVGGTSMQTFLPAGAEILDATLDRLLLLIEGESGSLEIRTHQLGQDR